jgi:hypothetical protein
MNSKTPKLNGKNFNNATLTLEVFEPYLKAYGCLQNHKYNPPKGDSHGNKLTFEYHRGNPIHETHQFLEYS